jgi:hypothetical protein
MCSMELSLGGHGGKTISFTWWLGIRSVLLFIREALESDN